MHGSSDAPGHGSLSGRLPICPGHWHLCARIRGQGITRGTRCMSELPNHCISFSLTKKQLIDLSGMYLLKCVTPASGLHLEVYSGDTDFDWLLSGSNVKSRAPWCLVKMLQKILLLSLGVLAPALPRTPAPQGCSPERLTSKAHSPPWRSTSSAKTGYTCCSWEL